MISSDSSNDKRADPTTSNNNQSRNETYLNESNLLKLLNETANQRTSSHHDNEAENDAALDEVWNNFDGDQFNDFYEYNPANETNKPDSVDLLDVSDSSTKASIVTCEDAKETEDHDEIVFEKSIEKNNDDDSTIDYHELELVLDQAEKRASPRLG